jgi:hypothetical protein
MRPGFFGITFLACAEAGADKLLLPGADHFSQKISQGNSAVVAGGIAAFDVFPNRVFALNSKLKRAGVFAFLPDGDLDSIDAIQ